VTHPAIETLYKLIAESEKTDALPSGLEKFNRLKAERSEYQRLSAWLIGYLSGLETQHEKLLSLVYVLQETTRANTNGITLWATELPSGRAPTFRRALNAILHYLAKMSRDTTPPC
jgi:hypothetical protein